MVRTIDPLVSTGWLEARLSTPPAGEVAEVSGLVVIDIREPHLFAAGHIPGSVSIPFSPVSDWAVSDDELLMELPPDQDLFRLIEDNDLAGGRPVVLVGTLEPPPAPPYALSDAPRVATTLIYAGVDDVAVLEGGYPKWAAEGRVTVTGAPAPPRSPGTAGDATGAGPAPVSYHGPVKAGMFVSTRYVKERLGKAVIIDGRDPDEFFGVKPCPFAGVGGHIPTARSLPARWIWREDGTYESREVLEQMVAGVVGADKDQEIITYCGVGGYAAAWWFVLTQMLGYANVRIYDGAAEAWVKEHVMVSFTW
jgi:thiosulfate/3-mercaptopyruvate sulfurtransferase